VLRSSIVWLTLFLFGVTDGASLADQPDSGLDDAAVQTMKRAASYYRGKVARHGGYVYYYSTDLKQLWGEGKAAVDTIFVEPPGTPAVGMAYLKAYAATGDKFYLDAAREAAKALVYGQLESGGWTQVIHFADAERRGKYRNGNGGDWNASSLDDGQTQTALQFLIRADRALEFNHADIHEATIYGLAALLNAQFPNGGFPQVWTGPVRSTPVLQAKFPDYDWKTEGRVKNYWDFYTLNDNLAGDVADTLILAHKTYKVDKYRGALAKLGDFLILAQMPDPQPGWCQQYNFDMVPIWARRFEPPAISGWESQDALATLIKIARYTGEKKYLEPIPRALEYFTKECLLPDGRVARFYEFKTNRPLYMDAEYKLTYSDAAAPSHYGWKQNARFEQIAEAFKAATAGHEPARMSINRVEEGEVRRIIRELDSDGRWVSTYFGEHLVGQPKFEHGFRYISSEVFIRNVEKLSEYIAASRMRPGSNP
jgi:PelA/Pel-15E family pectate lyase